MAVQDGLVQQALLFAFHRLAGVDPATRATPMLHEVDG
jgi:hypothetical protein